MQQRGENILISECQAIENFWELWSEYRRLRDEQLI
jgi:hypothetical protein